MMCFDGTPKAGLVSKGFTLLEMLVVLVIAAIAVAVVGVGGQSFMERSRYHQSIRDISTQLKQARALSVKEGRAITVAYQIDDRKLIVDGKSVLEIPAGLAVQWTAVDAGPKAASRTGNLIFIFNVDGGARGGRLAVYRAGQGVAFGVNWLLGTVEQAMAVAPS